MIRAVHSEDNTDNSVGSKLKREKAQGKEICQHLSQKSGGEGQSQDQRGRGRGSRTF